MPRFFVVIDGEDDEMDQKSFVVVECQSLWRTAGRLSDSIDSVMDI